MQNTKYAPVIKTIDATASWRRRVADDHPDDDRNLRCADALDALSDFVASTTDDRAVAALDTIVRLEPNDLWSPSEDGRYMLNRYGFDRFPVDPDPVETLEALAKAELASRGIVFERVEVVSAAHGGSTVAFTGREIAGGEVGSYSLTVYETEQGRIAVYCAEDLALETFDSFDAFAAAYDSPAHAELVGDVSDAVGAALIELAI